MAKFKLSLIVPNNDSAFEEESTSFSTPVNPDETYLASVITDFTDQQTSHNAKNEPFKQKTPLAHTYNEKISIHKNGQQELSFSVDDKIMLDNEWVENPFARVLRTGVQIELQDKFNNRKLFTVNKIQLTFNPVSIVYNITCQDSFTYQLSRQNSGYVLKNDENDIDFIGALDIDQWTERIIKDCYISYHYISLDTGLYQDTNGIIHTYGPQGDNVENPISLDSTSVAKIIKPIYDIKHYEDFYETFPFSASGSNADAALIAVGEKLGLQLNVIEGLDEGYVASQPIKYARYFFFGPTKNPEISGLTYSPLREIQNFNLSFAGNSLTTVLNVSSTTWNDEEISLLPKIPPFFNTLFNNVEWKKTTYYPGFYIEAVKGSQYGSSDTPTEFLDLFADDGGYYTNYVVEGYWVIPLLSFNWAYYYDKIHFYWEDKSKYFAAIEDTAGDIINPFTGNETIILGQVDFDDDVIIKTYQQDEIINDSAIGDTTAWCILVKQQDPNAQKLYIQHCFFTLTRDYTKEELDFAYIAEECPWLENKLMDFNYFVRQGILSRYEYNGLMDWLYNKLRIINGELICCANAYYTAIHKRTKILAKIEQDTDALGATFYASIIEPYTKTGTVSQNYSEFVNTYHDLFETDRLADDENSILSYNTIVGDRFNKYFSANQRFLQHIYNFRQYFESKNIYAAAGSNTSLDDVTYTITPATETTNMFVSFNGAVTWDSLSSNSKIIIKPNPSSFTGAWVSAPLYKYINNKYVLQKIPEPTTYQQFYVPLITAGSMTNIKNGHIYNPANTYYLRQDVYTTYFGTPLDDRIIELNNGSFIKLTKQEIIKIFLSQQTLNRQYYLKDTELKVPFEWVRTNYHVIKNRLAIQGWPAVSTLCQLNPDIPINDLEKYDSTTLWELYKSMSPIEELYIYDYYINYSTAMKDSGQTDYTWTIYDEQGIPYFYENNQFYKGMKQDGQIVKSTTVVAKADLFKKFYAVPFVSYAQNTTSLLSSVQNSTSANLNQVKFWTALSSSVTNSKYFAHYQDTTAKGWTIAGGQLFSLFSSLVIPGAGAACFFGGIVTSAIGCFAPFAYWGQNDYTNWPMTYYNGTKWREVTILNQNISKNAVQGLGSTTEYNGDSNWVNYVKQESSEMTMKSITEEWWKSVYRSVFDADKSYYKHYINYYQHIAATYSQGSKLHIDTIDGAETCYQNYNTYHVNYIEQDQRTGKYVIKYNTPNYLYDYYWIKNRYARFCKWTDGINYNDEYYIVPADFLTTDTVISDTHNFSGNLNSLNYTLAERFSAIKYYPLIALREQVNFQTLFTKEELKDSNLTWNDVISKLNDHDEHWTISTVSGTYVQYSISYDGGTPKKCYIIHSEPFEKMFIANETHIWDLNRNLNPNNFELSWKEANEKIYHTENDCELKNSELVLNGIKINENNTMVDVFYYIPQQDEILVLAENLEHPETYWLDSDTHWYTSNDIESRTYTVEQILENSLNYLYLTNATINRAEQYTNGTTAYDTSFNIIIRTYSIDENNQLLIDDQEQPYTIEKITFNPNITPQTVSFVYKYQNQEYTFNVTRTQRGHWDISTMSNGEFWYHFHNRIDFPTISENAMIIETQLTTEWMQAYTASHYCEWFIPEHWQLVTETSSNAWSSAIWQVTRLGRVMLSYQLVPEVAIYSKDNESELNGYIFHYHYGDTDLTGKEEYEIEQVEILKDNPAVLNAIKHIFNDNSNITLGRFTAQKYGTHTYYYYVSGGLAHKDIIHKLDNQQTIYTHYDGLYPMQLHLLLNKYYNLEMPRYEELCITKTELWRKLYTRYPGIFLENVYSNPDVRSSQQLLQMAKLAFKDYSSPEKQYNITVIDAAALEGYEGQELHIGDSILLNTPDYYDSVDETYRAINQYLYISDISYSLRQDTDIALTVNPIKYQDKLLQSIVKLIR